MSNIANNFKAAGLIAAVICVLALGCGINVTSLTLMPGNAQLLIDVQAREYVSPPCLAHLNYPDAARFSVRAAKQDLPKEFKPEQRCSEGIPGWFSKEPGFWSEESITMSFVRRWGVLSRKERWNSDGSWNW